MLAADTGHTTGWGWGQGGQTIEQNAKLAQAHIPRDKRDPKIHVPMIRKLMEARQANLHLDRDQIDPMAFPAGCARNHKKARQDNLHLDRDEIDPSVFSGAARDHKKARQDNLHLDRDDIDPMAFPAGVARDQKKARQDNLHLDRDDIDPMALPPGGPRNSKKARQDNIGMNYLDWRAKNSQVVAAIKRAQESIAALKSDRRVFGLSNPLGTQTTAFDPEAAFRELVGTFEGGMNIDDYRNKIVRTFYAFDRAIRFETSVDLDERWSIAYGVRLCAGSRNKDDSMPDFAPYSLVPLKVCTECGNTYGTIGNLTKHKKEKGH